jgi:hypothetical protein
VKYFDVSDPGILDFFVANATARVLVLLVQRGVEWSDDNSQPRACWDAPRHPIKLKRNLDDLLRPQKLFFEEAVSKAGTPYVFAKLNR